MIVETGTGLPSADAFISAADAVAFLTSRGYPDFALLDVAKQEAALINATEYLSTAFVWIGYRKTLDQSLAWPRVAGSRYLRVPQGIPRVVGIATARVANALTLGADVFATVSAGDLLKRAQAGSVQVEFFDKAADMVASGRAAFPWLVDLLAPLIVSGPDDPTSSGMVALNVERV